MARRRFFVDEVRNGVAAVTGDDAAHLTRVLRVEKGQRFEISDNENVWLAEVAEARKSLVQFQVVEPLDPGPAPPSIVLYAALFKFDRFEWMLEKVTELGVSRVVPVEAERSEHGLMSAAHKRAERWRRVAREAAQQSRRAKMPEIGDPVKLKQVRAEGLRLLLDELAGAAPLRLPENWSPSETISLMLGPEGGWTDEERAALVGAGWIRASLGPTVLRAETAAIAAMAVVLHATSIVR